MKRSKKIKITCSEHFRAGVFPKPEFSLWRVYPRIYAPPNISPVVLVQEGKRFPNLSSLVSLDPAQ